MASACIIYDQTCATEKRRRRKRSKLATPDKRVVINELRLRRLRRLLGAEQLLRRSSRSRPSSAAWTSSTEHLQPRLTPAPRASASRATVTVEGGPAEIAEEEPVAATCRHSLTHPRAGAAAGRTGVGIVVAGVGGTGVITIRPAARAWPRTSRARRVVAGDARRLAWRKRAARPG